MAKNYVNYQIELVPENAGVIDQINALMVNGYKLVSPSETASPSKENTDDNGGDNGQTLTIVDLKDAAKAAKKNHGDEFAMQVLKDNGVDVAASLGRSMGKVSEDKYPAVIAAWSAGPKEKDDGLDDDDDDDDDDGFGDDTPAKVDAEAVKVALKAYAKSEGRTEAKSVMIDNGAKVLSDVDNCSQEQLAAMLKAMV